MSLDALSSLTNKSGACGLFGSQTSNSVASYVNENTGLLNLWPREQANNEFLPRVGVGAPQTDSVFKKIFTVILRILVVSFKIFLLILEILLYLTAVALIVGFVALLGTMCGPGDGIAAALLFALPAGAIVNIPLWLGIGLRKLNERIAWWQNEIKG